MEIVSQIRGIRKVLSSYMKNLRGGFASVTYLLCKKLFVLLESREENQTAVMHVDITYCFLYDTPKLSENTQHSQESGFIYFYLCSSCQLCATKVLLLCRVAKFNYSFIFRRSRLRRKVNCKQAVHACFLKV